LDSDPNGVEHDFGKTDKVALSVNVR